MSMRLFFTILISMTVLGSTAQTYLPAGGYGLGFTPWQPVLTLPSFDNNNHHLQIKPFASLTAGYFYLNGGTSYISAPVGLMLARPLTNNWTAFAAATVTPIAFTSMYSAPFTDPSHGGYPFGRNSLGLSTGVQGGLIYTNDAKTFSISGSVRFDRSSSPVYPYGRVIAPKQ